MPSLVLFGRRTPVAGDDLRFFSLVSFVIRLLQFSLSISLLVLLIKHKRRNTKWKFITKEDCQEAGYNHGLEIALAYASVSIVLSLVEMASDVPMYIVSGRGTPTDTEPRKNLYPLCYFKLLFLNVFKCIACTLGFVSVFNLEEYCDCLEQEEGRFPGLDLKISCPDVNAWYGLVLTLVVTHAIDAGYALLCLAYFGCKFLPSISNLLHPETKWKAFCHCCCGLSSILTCCLFGGAEAITGDFADFACIMAEYFDDNHILDVTASDIIVGVLMVRRVQQEELQESRRRLRSLSQSIHNLSESEHVNSSVRPSLPTRALSASDLPSESVDTLDGADENKNNKKTKSLSYSHGLSPALSSDEGDAEEALGIRREVLDPSHPREKYLIAEGARFMAMAQAIYTWISYLLEHPATGLCDLACRGTFRSVCCQRKRYYSEGTVIGDYSCRQHSIALETISGISPEDIVYAQFKQGIKPKPYAIMLDHEWKSIVIAIRGTLSLEDLLADISIRPIELEKIGQECGFDGKGRYCHAGIFDSSEWIYRDLIRHGKLNEAKDKHSDYRIRIVGHSLGAGCAAALSVLLRPKFPNLRCLAFSPPGCVFSVNLAEECSEWLTSYILDADIVPRLAVDSFEDLRNQVLDMICRIKIPKHHVLRFRLPGFKDQETLSDFNSLALDKEGELKDSKFKQQLDEFYEFQASVRGKRKAAYIEMCPPGEIVQLFRTEHKKLFLQTITQEPNNNLYKARWATKEDFRKVIISSHMLADHDPINFKNQLQELAKTQFGLTSPYRAYFPTMLNSLDK